MTKRDRNYLIAFLAALILAIAFTVVLTVLVLEGELPESPAWSSTIVIAVAITMTVELALERLDRKWKLPGLHRYFDWKRERANLYPEKSVPGWVKTINRRFTRPTFFVAVPLLWLNFLLGLIDHFHQIFRHRSSLQDVLFQGLLAWICTLGFWTIRKTKRELAKS